MVFQLSSLPVMAFPLSFFSVPDLALGVQILQMTALGACIGIDDAIDKCRLARCERVNQSLGEAWRNIGHVMAGALECFDPFFVVARVFHENGR